MKIGNDKIVIATHVYAPGPAQELLKFLLKNKYTSKILFIGHPLFYSEKIKGSGVEVYSNSKKITEKYSKIKKIPDLVFYVYSFIADIFLVIKYRDDYNLYVGCNNLNALAGLILKKLGIVNKCVYYVVDYNPKRFTNPIVNLIYHHIDKISAVHCDETWNLSRRMIEARFKHSVIPDNQKVVPMGCWFDDIKRIPYEKCEKHTVVFMGHLLEKQGVQLLVSVIPEIIKNTKDFKLKIIGDGPFKKDLEKLVIKLGVEKHVEFLGYLKDNEKVYSIISNSAVTYALYDPKIASFTYYADPGKIKTYFSCGVPVMVTDVPEISSEIKEMKSGVVLEYSTDALLCFFGNVLSNDEKMRTMRNNAVLLGKKYNFDNIYRKALKEFYGKK